MYFKIIVKGMVENPPQQTHDSMNSTHSAFVPSMSIASHYCCSHY